LKQQQQRTLGTEWAASEDLGELDIKIARLATGGFKTSAIASREAGALANALDVAACISVHLAASTG